MNLYLVVLGGRINGGHVEMHDVRWVAGETIEATLPQLKTQWIGRPKGLHIDSYKLIKFVDGYRVTMVPKDEVHSSEVNKLWFINLGGYKSGEMLEQHHLELAVAPTAQIAKQKALKRWNVPMSLIHKDDQAAMLHLQEYTILLKPDSHGRDNGIAPDWSGYWVIS